MAQGAASGRQKAHRERSEDGAIRLALGMPLIRKVEAGLWEVRTRLQDRIARVIFTVEGDTMVLLHGFIKKSEKLPLQDLQLARQRLQSLRRE
jgi:phage-related protein